MRREHLLVGLVFALMHCGDSGGGGGADAGGGGGGGGTCPTTNFVPSAGFEACFTCTATHCCALMQACDRDETCLYCQSSAGRLDTARCTDPTTFEVYPPTARMRACQTEYCLAPCGTPGNLCTPANCNAMCSNFSTNCQ